MTAHKTQQPPAPTADRADLANAIATARELARVAERALADGDLAAARRGYEEALEALPNNAELLVKLGAVCLQMGLALPAERAYSIVLRSKQSDIHPAVFSAAFQGLLQTNALSGQHERNAEMLVRNSGALLQDQSFLDVLALALLFTGNLRALADCADAFLACNPLPHQLPQLALALIRAGRERRGLDVMAAVARSQPGDPGIIALLVRAMAAAGKLPSVEAAQTWLKDRAKLDPAPVFTHYQFARYADVSETLEILGRETDFPVHHDYHRPVPVSSGRSRFAYGRAYDRPDPDRWVAPTIDPAVVARSLTDLRGMVRDLKDAGAFEIQLRNIAAARQRFAPEAGDPVQVLSTGRCGTRALYYLLRPMETVLPFHSAQFATIAADRNHLLYRLLTGTLDRDAVAEIALTYLQTRTAELIHAYARGRTPILVTHWDTIFGAVNAELFPEMRFLYLHRAPGPVFKSIFGKNQWQNSQLMHLVYDRTFPDGDFVCRIQQDLSMEQRVSWYLHVTRVLARGLLADLEPGRGRELASEKMFAASDEAFETLADLIPGWAMDKAAFAAHFGQRRNAKEDLLQVDEDELEDRASRVPARLEEQGRF